MLLVQEDLKKSIIYNSWVPINQKESYLMLQSGLHLQDQVPAKFPNNSFHFICILGFLENLSFSKYGSLPFSFCLSLFLSLCPHYPLFIRISVIALKLTLIQNDFILTSLNLQRATFK
jgi:hypothetical protein